MPDSIDRLRLTPAPPRAARHRPRLGLGAVAWVLAGALAVSGIGADTSPAFAQAGGDEARPEAKAKPRKVSTRRAQALVKTAATSCKILHPQRCEPIAELVGFGPGAGPPVAALLKAKEAKVRMAAATALGQLRHKDSGEALLGALKDSNPGVRSAAITAVGLVKPEGSVEALAASLGASDVNQKIAAALALGHTYSPGAVSPLLKALEHFHPKVKAAAARSLASVGDPRAVTPLAVQLADPKTAWPARAAIATALGRLGKPEAVPTLLMALGDKEDQVRLASIKALGLTKDPRAVAVLGLLVRESRLAFDASEALGRIGSQAALPALIRVIKERRHPPEVLEKTFWALGAIGSKSAVPALSPLLKDEDVQVATWAADALGHIADDSASEALFEAVKREDKDVKEMAAWALEQISGKPLGTDVELWETWLYSPERQLR